MDFLNVSSIFIDKTDKSVIQSKNKRTLLLCHQTLVISIKLVITYKFHPIRDRLEIIMAQPGYKFVLAPGICHDKHTGIKTLKIRKLTERILNIRRMLHLKEAVGHHHIATQRIRLEPHNIYCAAPIHKFLIGERWNPIQCGDFPQLHIDAFPVLILRQNVGGEFLHIADIQQKSLIIRMIEFLYLHRI